MYHVSAQGVDERMINVYYYCYYYYHYYYFLFYFINHTSETTGVSVPLGRDGYTVSVEPVNWTKRVKRSCCGYSSNEPNILFESTSCVRMSTTALSNREKL